MFKILASDGQEYGPVPAETLRQWITQNRANGQTKVLAEGTTEWRPLSSFPEFADVLRGQFAGALPPISSEPLPNAQSRFSTLPADVVERNYDLNIGACLDRAWSLVTGPIMWTVIGGVALWILIQMGIAGLGGIPLIGPLFSLANLVIGGPLIGGVYLFLLRCLRGQPATVDNLFDGFRYRFVQLFLAHLVMMLLTCAVAIPGGILIGGGVIPMAIRHEPVGWAIALIVAGVLLLLIPIIYLSVCWMFTLPLVADKGLDFWPAMQTSRKVVSKHWWFVFLIVIVVGIISIAGALLCCVGWFFTAPLAFTALLAAYEIMFSPRPALPA